MRVDRFDVAHALYGGEEVARAPEAPDTGSLLDAISRFVRRYVVVSREQQNTLALWSAHTWVIEAFDATPYLSISSVEKQSGKTRLLEVLELLVCRSWPVARVTAAALARAQDPT